MEELEYSWSIFELEDSLHAVPVADIKQHEASEDCPCNPEIEYQPDGMVLITHNSFDGREDFENGIRKPS